MRGRLWLVAPWALFALMAAAWTGYWFYAAGQAKAAIAHWAQSEAQAGGTARFGALRAHGFPVLLRVAVRGFAYAPADEGWRVETARFDAHFNLINSEQAGVIAQAPIVITYGEGARVQLSADTLIATLRRRGGAATRVSLQGGQLTLDDPAQAGEVRVESVLVNARPDPRKAGSWQVAAEAEGLHLARPARGLSGFGQEVESVRALAVLDEAAALIGSRLSLEAWREAEGAVRFDAIAARWGALDASGSGEAKIDAAHRLSGSLALTLSRAGEAMAALTRDEATPADVKERINTIGAGLTLVDESAPLNVTAEAGALSVEDARVRDLAPLY